MHFRSSSLAQSPRARLQCRPCGENVIHQKHYLSGIAPSRLDRPAHVAAPFRGREPGLALPSLYPRQGAGFPGLTACARKRLGEPSGLIEAANGKSRPMHGCRRDEIGALERITCGCTHPTREDRQAVAAAAALEIKHQTASVVVIGERGAGGVVGNLAARAGAANAVRAGIVGQRETAAAALWVAKKLQRAPERRLDYAGAIHDLLGQKRAWRPDQVRQPRDRATFPESGAWAIGYAQ